MKYKWKENEEVKIKKEKKERGVTKIKNKTLSEWKIDNMKRKMDDKNSERDKKICKERKKTKVRY